MTTTDSEVNVSESYLYHYTSIEALAMILSTRSFRFSRLDQLDDALEGLSSDVREYSRFFYASSWTRDETESIAFWHIYAGRYRGVRIGLPRHPFLYYDSINEEPRPWTNTSSRDRRFLRPVVYEPKERSAGDGVHDTDNAQSLTNMERWRPEAFHSSIGEVEYLDDLDPMHVGDQLGDNGVTFDVERIGRRKSKQWKFQQEERYLISAVPLPQNSPPQISHDDILSAIIRSVESAPDGPIAIYAPLADYALDRMRITLGPCATESDWVIVRSLLSSEGLSASVSPSELTRAIRCRP